MRYAVGRFPPVSLSCRERPFATFYLIYRWRQVHPSVVFLASYMVALSDVLSLRYHIAPRPRLLPVLVISDPCAILVSFLVIRAAYFAYISCVAHIGL